MGRVSGRELIYGGCQGQYIDNCSDPRLTFALLQGFDTGSAGAIKRDPGFLSEVAPCVQLEIR